MGNAVVHFEVIGREPDRLREYYQGLFDWQFDTGGPVAPAVSAAGQYGFTAGNTLPDGTGIPGGIGGGADYRPQTIFYVAVPDVEAALQKAESLGGKRVLGPEQSPGSPLVIGQFTDPEGNLMGVAQVG